MGERRRERKEKTRELMGSGGGCAGSGSLGRPRKEIEREDLAGLGIAWGKGVVKAR